MYSFNFEGIGEVRAFNREGDAWFVAKDVATLLGYTNTRKAILDHCKAAVSVGSNSAFPFDPQTKIIPESDVYLLISKSRTIGTKAKQDMIQKFQAEGFLNEVVLHSPPELEFVELVKPVLEYLELDYTTQKVVGDYRVDLYLPDINLAVEFDEDGHKSYDQVKEKQRESFISKTLSCGILRVTSEEDIMISAFRLFKLLPPTPKGLVRSESEMVEEKDEDLMTKAMLLLQRKIQEAEQPKISILDSPFVTRIA